MDSARNWPPRTDSRGVPSTATVLECGARGKPRLRRLPPRRGCRVGGPGLSAVYAGTPLRHPARISAPSTRFPATCVRAPPTVRLRQFHADFRAPI